MAETLNGQILDRRIPTDWKHADKYKLRAMPNVEAAFPVPPPGSERLLNVQRTADYRRHYDQGRDGACVGFSQSWDQSILNRTRYDALWLYRTAQAIDEWDDTPPEEGTSLRAGFDVLRQIGHRQFWGGRARNESLHHGISANRWTTNVDEVRATIWAGVPANLGIWWYRQFSNPAQLPRLDDAGRPVVAFGIERFDWWIGRLNVQWGPRDGGHAISIVGFDDRREAFALRNTWGDSYPFLVWLPYASYERLMDEDGETGIVTDR